jgi:hypothetical protein
MIVKAQGTRYKEEGARHKEKIQEKESGET